MNGKPDVALWDRAVFVRTESDKVAVAMKVYATRYMELSEEHWYAICPNMSRIRDELGETGRKPLYGREVEDFFLRKYVRMDGTLQVTAKF